MPCALALVLTLAGSTSPREDAVATVGQLQPAPVVPVVTAEVPASVTVVDPQRWPAPGDTPSDLPPAVQVVTTGEVVHAAVKVDIADVLLEAYQAAAAGAPEGCHLPVSLLAAIGQVESGSLVGRPLDAEHRTSVLGPVLDGNGFAAISDTDHGRWDGDATWDRAVGPMQFIPGTWARFGVDGDGDGVAHPQDIEDAAAATAAYLCYGGRDLSQPADRRAAILSYNHSEAYLRLVSTYQERYAKQGLDDALTVAGLPTSISLTATPTGTEDGWAARLRAKASADDAKLPPAPKRVGKPVPVPKPSGGSSSSPPGTPSGAPSGPPSGTPTDTPTDTPTGPSGPPSETPAGGSGPGGSGGGPSEPPPCTAVDPLAAPGEVTSGTVLDTGDPCTCTVPAPGTEPSDASLCAPDLAALPLAATEAPS